MGVVLDRVLVGAGFHLVLDQVLYSRKCLDDIVRRERFLNVWVVTGGHLLDELVS